MTASLEKLVRGVAHIDGGLFASGRTVAIIDDRGVHTVMHARTAYDPAQPRGPCRLRLVGP